MFNITLLENKKKTKSCKNKGWGSRTTALIRQVFLRLHIKKSNSCSKESNRFLEHLWYSSSLGTEFYDERWPWFDLWQDWTFLFVWYLVKITISKNMENDRKKFQHAIDLSWRLFTLLLKQLFFSNHHVLLSCLKYMCSSISKFLL